MESYFDLKVLARYLIQYVISCLNDIKQQLFNAFNNSKIKRKP